jgi:hypothetical protein
MRARPSRSTAPSRRTLEGRDRHAALEVAAEEARRCAEEGGWVWREPVIVKRSRAFVLVGRVCYEVRTNAEMRGSNARIVVDAEDGSIAEAHWLPR